MTLDFSEQVNRIAVIKETVQVIKGRYQPHDTGHLRTTVSTLEEYIRELEGQLDDTYTRVAEG